MLDYQIDGKRFIIDIRERLAKGEHPRRDILNVVKASPLGTIFEIHLPHRPDSLAATFQSLGMNSIITELEPMHFRLMAVKLEDN